MKIAVITSAASIDGEAKFINEMFDSGLELLHLRKPEMGKMNFSLLLDQIKAEYHDRIALHSHHELTAYFGIKRLHYPETLRTKEAQGELREQNPDKILSTSIHSLEEINLIREFDYSFFGPVFTSFSKPDYFGIGIENLDLNEVKKATTPLFALGGIDANNIATLKPLGFKGAGLLGWLWNNPESAVSNFKHIKWIAENMY